MPPCTITLSRAIDSYLLRQIEGAKGTYDQDRVILARLLRGVGDIQVRHLTPDHLHGYFYGRTDARTGRAATDQRDQALRMALERLLEYPSPWAAAQALGPKLGVGPETLRKWIVQAQVDDGDRPGPSSAELAEIKALKSQVRDLTEH